MQEDGFDLRVALITPLRSYLREPFAGGLETFSVDLGTALRERGHDVEIFGGHGSDPGLGITVLGPLPQVGQGRQDISNDPLLLDAERRAYQRLIAHVAASRFDVIHDNTMHDLLINSSADLRVPVVTTLHTPPIGRVVAAMSRSARPAENYVAVSRSTAKAWRHAAPGMRVIRNGVDLQRWHFGDGGGVPVWAGRLVEEKGVELAVRAAQLAGTGLRIAGRIQDPIYFRECIEPLLGGCIQYVGHLEREPLRCLVRSASVVVVTPCWDEPYGLVAAEALASGTPVAGFARGGLIEVVGKAGGVLVEPGDVNLLASALRRASYFDRRAVRATAEAQCSLESTTTQYEQVFEEQTENWGRLTSAPTA